MNVKDAIMALLKAINDSTELNSVQKTHFTAEIFKMEELFKMSDDINFTRAELQILRQRSETLAERVPNPSWKRVYINIAEALDHLDAMWARAGANIDE